MDNPNEATATAPKKAAPKDMEATVAAGGTAFQKAELEVRQAQKAALDLIPVFTKANSQMMMGGIETQQMIADAKAAAGLMAQGEAILWRLHAQSYEIEKKNDIGISGPLGGGPR